MRVNAEDLHKMIRAVTRHLPTSDGVPDLRLLHDDYLQSIDRALVGVTASVDLLRGSVRGELSRRELPLFSMPLRPVEDFDPEKNRMDL